MRTETKEFQDQAIGPLEEVTTNASELKHFQVELERLEAVTRIVFDDNHSIEFHLQQLEEQINSKKLDLLEMKSQWWGIISV